MLNRQRLVSSEGALDVRALIDAWREGRGDAVKSVRAHLIEALARRAASHTGEARALLDRRLVELIQADDESRVAATLSGAQEPPNSASLAELLAYLNRREGVGEEGAPGAVSWRAAYPELPVVDYFQKIWSGLNTSRQLRQSLKQVPENAGPLNSSSLVHRSLALMGALSPDYLEHFLAHIDALSWMEKLKAGGAEAGKASHAGSRKKGVRGR